MKPLTWETLDWPTLDRLRETFLASQPGVSAYWSSFDDLANYDFTYARRIGWKWDAVLRELRQRGWTPPPGPLMDWGCGSGIAGRRVLEFFGPDLFKRLRLFDRSPLAMEFAAEAAHVAFPRMDVGACAESETGVPGTLIISHILNELDEAGGRALRKVIDGAEAVLWVEPGTPADSRALIALRESLRDQFHVIAPCTHQAGCGLLAPENSRHWCHHFAAPPPGIMGDSNWVRFAQRAGVDLRSLPYSFLVLERKGLRDPTPGLLSDDWSRVLGQSRVYKGFTRVLSCQSDGVRDLELQKRVNPEVHRAFKHGSASSLWQWKVEGRRIVGLESIADGVVFNPKSTS